jgi:hypothetical protein
MSARDNEVPALALRYAVQQFSDFLSEFVHGSFGGFAQQRLEFGKELFYWVQVGRIGRQIEIRWANRNDRFFDSGHFVTAEII